jgi:spermidine/putrescine transport system substrate-binding protein
MLKTSFPLGAAAALAFVSITACGGDGDASDAPAADCQPGQTDGPLRMFNWAEYIDEEQVAEFATQFGIEYSIDAFESNESMQALVAAGNSNFDLVVPSDYMVGIMIAGGHLLKLDQDALPNLVNISETFRDPTYDPGMAHSVPYQWGYSGIAVDTTVLGDDYPRSWSLIFGPDAAEYSGRISVLNSARDAIGAALKYLGYSANSTVQAELDEASALLSDAKENILAFDTDSADDFLLTGETVIAHSYSGQVYVAALEVDNPEDYEFFVPKEGGIRWTDNFAIPFDAPHPCTAHTFINWMLQGEQHARLTNWNSYGSPNDAATEFLTPGIQDSVSDAVLAGPPDLIENLLDTGDFEIQYSDAFIRAKG